jgi:hypothetical protein
VTLSFEGEAVWVHSIEQLVDLGIHFACIGSVQIDGFTYYIIQCYRDTVQRMRETPDLLPEIDWMEIPRG